ncbi:MAG: FHA domain-containing protein [Ktedonobacteraceae bacterium]|nr:FHA domain-containing protein [Ktedonobacteraceae bacterium]
MNCGNRLTPATPSPASTQAQTGIGDATIATPDDWGSPADAGWSEAGATIAASESQAYGMEPAATAQATMERIERPARLVLRSENGEELQEFLLEKHEMTVGRAPNSDILLSKDKLTSRRHATVRYENGDYVIRDERSANGTYVNGQQLEEMVPRLLHDSDLVGIGEHELIFRAYAGSVASRISIEDLPTVRFDSELPMRDEDRAPVEAGNDEFKTRMDASDAVNGLATSAGADSADASHAANAISTPSVPKPTSSFASTTSTSASTPSVNTVSPTSASASSGAATSSTASAGAETGMTISKLSHLPLPALPDVAAVVAALATLDGQVMSLQERFSGTQQALHSYETEIAQMAGQLRNSVRRVVERMDNTIADVARSREALAWADLLQLMEDVMNNPRDIEYVTKMARKARELNKVFQIHQSVLNTMAECNSLLRSLIGEDS